MKTEENKKKRYKPAERVSLTPDNVSLLEKMLGQVHESQADLKLTKSDMVNWLLKSRKDKLGDREIAAIEREYFDPVKALEATIVEAKRKQGLGEKVDIEALVNEKLLVKKRRTPGRKSLAKSKAPGSKALIDNISG